jgi:hypothetical protein
MYQSHRVVRTKSCQTNAEGKTASNAFRGHKKNSTHTEIKGGTDKQCWQLQLNMQPHMLLSHKPFTLEHCWNRSQQELETLQGTQQHTNCASLKACNCKNHTHQLPTASSLATPTTHGQHQTVNPTHCNTPHV